MRQLIIIIETICGFLVVLLPFLYTYRGGRLRNGVIFCWGALSAYVLCLALISIPLVKAYPELSGCLPDGSHFLLFFLIAGWVYGLAIAGLGVFARRIRKRKLSGNGDSAGDS
jgi:hypothetical protein